MRHLSLLALFFLLVVSNNLLPLVITKRKYSSLRLYNPDSRSLEINLTNFFKHNVQDKIVNRAWNSL